MMYTNVKGYQIPNLSLPKAKKTNLNRYGRMRLDYLEQNEPNLCDQMMLEGTLYPHLVEMDNAVHRQIEQTMQTLMQQSTAPNRQTDPMGWTQWMNALQAQAEELAMQQIYSL